MSGKYNRKDHLYQKAKEEGYRSRAAYKLLELQKKHRLISPGSKVLDLGAWPGGWLQAARELAGPQGRIVGIDLVEIEDFGDESIKTIKADITDDAVIKEASVFAGGQFDLVLSDLSPKLSGIREVDQGAMFSLASMAMQAAQSVLNRGGHFVCKLFKGADAESFVKAARDVFNKVVRVELDATRRTSNEFYLVCLGLKAILKENE